MIASQKIPFTCQYFVYAFEKRFIQNVHISTFLKKQRKREKQKKSRKKEGKNFINAFSSCECDNKLKMAYCDI